MTERHHDAELEERYMVFNDRLSERKTFSAYTKHRRDVRRVREIGGQTVLTPPQIRTVAFLLGFDDGSYNPASDGPFGVSSSTYRRHIQPLIPPEAQLDLSQFGVNTRGYDNVGYSLEGVEEALEQLGSKGKIQYTHARFLEAVQRP